MEQSPKEKVDSATHVREEMLIPTRSEWGIPCATCQAAEAPFEILRDKASNAHQTACLKYAHARCKVLAVKDDPKALKKALLRLQKLKDVVYHLRIRWLVAEDNLYAACDRTVICLIHCGIGSRYH